MANMDDAGGYGIILKWRRVGLEMGKYYPFTNYGIERGQWHEMDKMKLKMLVRSDL